MNPLRRRPEPTDDQRIAWLRRELADQADVLLLVVQHASPETQAAIGDYLNRPTPQAEDPA